MKKMRIFALMLFAGATIFTSCKKDEATTADPTISFPNGNSLAYTAGASINVMVNFAAEGSIQSVTLNKPTTSGTQTVDITNLMGTSGTDNAKNQTSATYVFTVDAVTLGSLVAAHPTGLSYTFTLTDQDSRTTTGTYTVTITAAGNPINTYTAQLLGAQNNAAGSFFASATGTIYSQSQAAANAASIDITYGVIGTTSTIMSLPERANNGFTAVTGGPTVYYKASSITAAQFDAMTDDLGFANITASTTPKVTVAQGSVYEFVNGTKKGLIKVTNLTAGTSGSITIDVKVQQ